jgi:DNA-binding NarL/FixJ family response regulator
VRVLIAVAPQALSRVVEHVLQGHQGLALVGSADSDRKLATRARRTSPDLVVVSLRLLGRHPGASLVSLRETSPGSKLIVISPGTFAPPLRPRGADAIVREEALVRRLVPLLRRLTGRRARRQVPAQP